MKKSLPLFFFIVAATLGPAVFGVHRVLDAALIKNACQQCHSDFKTLLSADHPSVGGNDLSSCLVCHQPDKSYQDKKNPFFARIHLAHLLPDQNMACLICHSWSEGKSFGLQGLEQTWGSPSQEYMDFLKEIFTSWATSTFTDNLHARAFVSCSNCHDQALPAFDASVENSKCLQCHGPMDKLAKHTEPVDFKDRNPHLSHLGEIGCTVCHKAHSESVVYCLGCHQQFKMKIQGSGVSNSFNNS